MIVVTGANGKIGSHLVKVLARRGEHVRAVVRNLNNAVRLKDPHVEVVQADLGKPETLARAMKGAQRLFLNSPSDPDAVEWHRNVLVAAREMRMRLVVRISVIGADRGSPLQIARWHAEAEADLRMMGVPWCVLQPHSFMQNMLGNARSIRDGAFYGAMGDGRIPSIDVTDIAEVAAAVLTTAGHESKTYALTGPEALSYAEMARHMGAVLGKEVRYIDVPAERFVRDLVGMGLPQWLADDYGAMQRLYAAGKFSAVSRDVEKILGHKPRTFDQFLRDNLGAFRV